MEKDRRRTLFFSLLIAMYPILSSYGLQMINIDFATIILLIFFVWTLPTTFYRNIFVVFVLYIAIMSPLSYIVIDGYEVSRILIFFRWFKIVLSLFLVFVCGYWQRYFDEKLVLEYIKKIMYLASLFIIAQRALGIVGVTLSNPFIALAMDSAYVNGYSMMSGSFFRPSAFFLEPAHFSVYAFVFLVYSLFSTKNIKDIIVVCIGILCTGSGIGLVGVSGFVALYAIIQLRHHFVLATLMSICGLYFYVWLTNLPYFKFVIERFTTDNIQGGGNAIQARIGDGYALFVNSDIFVQIFGSGYGNIVKGVYFNGVTYSLNTLGICGTLIFFLTLIYAFNRGVFWKKIGVLSFIGLAFVSQVLTPASLVFYFSIYSTKLYANRNSEFKERML